MNKNRIYLLVLSSLISISVLSQEYYIDKEYISLIDSLDQRISYLNNKIPKLSANRDAQFFHTKRDLDMTIFVREYEELIFDEKLVEAQALIDSRIKVSTKRADKYALEYYGSYKTALTKLRGQKRAHYQRLFAREKDFKKEYKEYIAPADESAYLKTIRMLELALKYAQEKHYNETVDYLFAYKSYTEALLFDLNNKYDLDKLTSSEANFLKVFEPMVEHDSLHVILQSDTLLSNCLYYAGAARAKVDTNFFVQQKLVVSNAIADWNERQGLSTELASLTEQAVVARRDTVNPEGIYQWNDLIVVIGSVNFDSKSPVVRRGEAIINSDKTLIKYIRANKLASVNRSVQMGKTTIIPVKNKEQYSYFQYNAEKQAWQYIVTYTSVISPKFTKEMAKFLSPLQFQDQIVEKVP